MKNKLLLSLLVILFILPSFSFSQTDLKKKIAAMVMVGFDGTTAPDSLIKDITDRGLGSVILFARNVTSPSQLKNLTAQLQSYSRLPLLISIDQEGGNVARLGKSNGYTKTKTAYNLGTVINSLDTTAFWSLKMANWLSDGGINVNLAPDVDVNVNPNSPAIGGMERSFSALPLNVFNHAQKFIDMFSSKGIITALKHFPGHGSALVDSHLGFTDITNTWADSELVPFRKIIQNNYKGFIMAGHLYNAHLDSLYPASLSHNVITGLLRNQLGFNGIVITDGMFMQAISNNYSFDKAIELAINAGDDILLYTTNLLDNHSLLDSVVNIVMAKIDSGKINPARIEESYQRIMAVRQGFVNSVKDNKDVASIKGYSITNYPNPFNPATTIECNVLKAGTYSITLYDILGSTVSVIHNGYLPAGINSIPFNAGKLPSGVYLYRLSGNNVNLSKKMVIIK